MKRWPRPLSPVWSLVRGFAWRVGRSLSVEWALTWKVHSHGTHMTHSHGTHKVHSHGTHMPHSHGTHNVYSHSTHMPHSHGAHMHHLCSLPSTHAQIPSSAICSLSGSICSAQQKSGLSRALSRAHGKWLSSSTRTAFRNRCALIERNAWMNYVLPDSYSSNNSHGVTALPTIHAIASATNGQALRIIAGRNS